MHKSNLAFRKTERQPYSMIHVAQTLEKGLYSIIRGATARNRNRRRRPASKTHGRENETGATRSLVPRPG
eukprot:9347224-Pyramimonas_sp.AAC.1